MGYYRLTKLLAIIFAILLLTITVISVPIWQAQSDLNAGRITWEEVPDQVNAYRKTTIQIAGGLVVAIGLYLTWHRIQVTEEGQVTDRFSTAVEQLGNQRLEVRLGGIYALERIAQDSPRDHWTVMETLSAFIRENASNTDGVPTHDGGPTPDVHAACKVIGRRTVKKDPEGSSIDLSGAQLSGLRLEGADFSDALLSDVNLSNAVLQNSDLSNSDLIQANLSGVMAAGINLSNADAGGADLSGGSFDGGRLEDCALYGSDLSDSTFVGANLSDSILREATLNGALFWDANLEDVDVDAWQLCKSESLKSAKIDTVIQERVEDRCPDVFKSPDYIQS